jgi:hypothetical protein
MVKAQLSAKRLAITKANAQVIAVVAVASFVTVFCLVSAKVVLSQNTYQQHVITAKDKANAQFKSNVDNVKHLITAYQAFVAQPVNIIGGNSTGTGDSDGTNDKIVLDALPDTYDFPALTSSLEKILTDQAFKISNITGTDDELSQQSNGASPNPQPVTIPFSFSVTNANYASVEHLITTLQLSIRPIQIDSIDLSGGSSDMQLTVTAHTYYQPTKNLGITKKVIN